MVEPRGLGYGATNIRQVLLLSFPIMPKTCFEKLNILLQLVHVRTLEDSISRRQACWVGRFVETMVASSRLFTKLKRA